MAFQKILCPIDFSAGSDHALRVAARLATRWNAELVIVHALYPQVYASEYAYPPAVFEQMIEDAERGLAAAERDAKGLGATRVTTKLLRGNPWQAIVEALREDTAFDLVVIGTHGRTGLSRVLLGSVAEKIVRHAPCPVLTTRERGDVSPFRNVFCPIDFSEGSQHAIELAAKVVEPGGPGITLFHAIEVPASYSEEPSLRTYEEAIDKEVTQLLAKWAADLRTKVSVPVATRSQIGHAGAQTLAILDGDPSFDLVITGSHGRTGLKRALLGSVAEKIVRHAPCPVLVARRREEE